MPKSQDTNRFKSFHLDEYRKGRLVAAFTDTTNKKLVRNVKALTNMLENPPKPFTDQDRNLVEKALKMLKSGEHTEGTGEIYPEAVISS